MTSEEFKRVRMALGFTQGGLAAEWGMGQNGGRSIRRWECGQRPVSPNRSVCHPNYARVSHWSGRRYNWILIKFEAGEVV